MCTLQPSVPHAPHSKGGYAIDDTFYSFLSGTSSAQGQGSTWPPTMQDLMKSFEPGARRGDLSSITASSGKTAVTTTRRTRDSPPNGTVRLRWRKPATQSTGVKKRRPSDKKVSTQEERKGEAGTTACAELVRASSPPSPRPVPPPSISLGDIGYWWWYCPDSIAPAYRVARNVWVESQWELAQQSAIFQECVKLFAKRKRSQLAGYMPVPGLEDGYLAQKCHLLQTIRSQMQKSNREVDNIDLTAIAVLAYCSLLDAQYDAARTHLNAMKALNLPKRFANASQGWLYIIGLDLRFSMFENRPPILDYFIPDRYRQDQIPELQDLPADVLWPLTERTNRMCPHCPELNEAECFDMLIKLHSLFHAWPQLESTQNPPFGHLYELEYRIRVADARLVRHNQGKPFDQSHCSELLLVALHLHLWIVQRFWAPISPKSRQFLLTRACRLISTVTARELMTRWTAKAQIKSLLWVLATITASAIEIGLEDVPVPLTALREAAALCGAEDREGFVELLREWPWLDNWHETKSDWLWDAVCDLDGQGVSPKFMASRTPSRGFYLGAVEFYNS